MSKTLFMESTEVSVTKTAGEIAALLVAAGASRIGTDYGAGGAIKSLHFTLTAEGKLMTFALPARTESIYKHLYRKARRPNVAALQEQAARVAWRQLLRWIQAQLALIETGMVVSAEVFMPYAVHPGTEQTMFQAFMESGLKLLPPAGGGA